MGKKTNYTIAREMTYQNGQVIFQEGSISNSVYMIISGAVETFREVRGHKFVIEKLKPGDLFGETALVGDLKQSFTATAIGKTTLGIVDMAALKKEYGQLSKQFRSIVETIPLRLKKILDRATDFSD